MLKYNSVLFILILLKQCNFQDPLISEMTGLSELPLDRLLHMKNSLEKNDLMAGIENDAEEIEDRREIVSRLGVSEAHALINGKFKKPLQRGGFEMWQKKGQQKNKVSTIFQIAVTALAFLAFAGYLLCLLVQAIRAKQAAAGTATTANGAVVFATPIRRVRPIIIRQKRSAIWPDADPDLMYHALKTFSEGYATYHAIDYKYFNFTADSFV